MNVKQPEVEGLLLTRRLTEAIASSVEFVGRSPEDIELVMIKVDHRQAEERGGGVTGVSVRLRNPHQVVVVGFDGQSRDPAIYVGQRVRAETVGPVAYERMDCAHCELPVWVDSQHHAVLNRREHPLRVLCMPCAGELALRGKYRSRDREVGK